jgi:hypothetical protein
VAAAHEDLRRLCHEARTLLSTVPPSARADSPRAQESRALRLTSGGGGRARATFLDRLNVDGQIAAAALSLFVDGVADCLEVASNRENAVNVPALSCIVRPALEIAGQIAWLLAEPIDGTERARRYVVWRFADLRSQRMLLRDFRPTPDASDAADDLEADERSLLEDVKASKWQAQATIVRNAGIEYAALLDHEGRREKMPTPTDLVRHVSSTPSVYALLSTPVHGARHGSLYGVHGAEAPDGSGRYNVGISGFGVPPNLGIGLALLALGQGCGSIVRWNGIDPGLLLTQVKTLMNRAGIS